MKRILVVDDEPELLEVLREIPVIMVTVNAENAIAAECIRQGAFGYVPKPFNLM
jgi:CheY-like chemotaxis protein